MGNRGHGAPQAQFRLAWVDVARGLGIVAVVVGHVWTSGPVRQAMYSFHMPLFFLLSGMLSRPHPALPFARRQILGQMRPYILFLLILILADQGIERLKGNLPIFHHWPQDVGPILLGGSWLRGPFTIFWFVPCLMAARILFNLVLARWSEPLDRRWGLVLLPIGALAYGVGAWTHMSVLGMLSVPMAFVLLWAGAAWPHIRWRGWMVVPLGLLAAAAIAGLMPPLDMKVADYGWPVLSIAAAVATSLLLFRLSALAVPMAAPIAVVGRASLVIMYLHAAFIHYLTPYWGKAELLAVALIGPLVIDWLIRRSARLRTWLL